MNLLFKVGDFVCHHSYDKGEKSFWLLQVVGIYGQDTFSGKILKVISDGKYHIGEIHDFFVCQYHIANKDQQEYCNKMIIFS